MVIRSHSIHVWYICPTFVTTIHVFKYTVPIFSHGILVYMAIGFNPQMATEIRGVSVASPFHKQLHPAASREAVDRRRSRLAASELQAWRVEAVRQASMQPV